MATGGAQPANPLNLPGRYGNGPTWAEKLTTEYLNLPPLTNSLAGGTNHAWGGAWTDGGGPVPTVVEQIGSFTAAGGSFSSTDLVSIWAGANDFFFGVTDPSVSAANIGTAINLLGAAGAENILVLNLPDLGKTPDIMALGAPTVAGMSALVGGYNTLLALELDAKRTSLGINIFEADIYGLNEMILSDPGAWGLANTDTPASLTGNEANADTFAYWDGVHPTDAVHDFFAAEAAQAIGVPEPSSALLLLSSALVCFTRRRR